MATPVKVLIKREDAPAVEPVVEATAKVKAKVVPLTAIQSSREVLKHPLPNGQKFFESPEGWIVLGEADKDHVFCRQANGGKGAFINPMR